MIISTEVDYWDADTLCRGFIAFDDSILTVRPGVLIAHDWGGRGESVCDKARLLASLGYVGFALDMYGQAQQGQDKPHRRALMAPLMQDRRKLINRITAAFHCLAQHEHVDRNNIAAIGYCFGGLCVLDLARSGVDVKAVASFHGLLTAPEGMNAAPINAKILILHGYDDPLVKPEQVNQFALEMTDREADWQIHLYGLTAHSFTNPEANDDEMGLHYNAQSDHRSWKSTEYFLKEAFSVN